MDTKAHVFRNEKDLAEGLKKVKDKGIYMETCR
jgi:hypothetical protein